MNIRALAAKAIFNVLEKGLSLSVALPAQQNRITSPKDKALLAEICYGVMRTLPQLDKLISNNMNKPLKGKQRIIYQLLLVGCYQLYFTRIPSHAAISETSEACRQLGFESLVKLVNAILRNIQRQQLPLPEDNDTLKYNMPGWIVSELKKAYPDYWQQIVEQSHQRPPMWLRNNRLKQTRSQYMAQLEQAQIDASAGQTADSILLSQAQDVSKLPGFFEGSVSVQDAAAQFAAELLAPQDHDLILDACAAPGGKTCHILELAPKASVVAVDFDEKRLARVTENLARLNLTAQVIHGDAANIDDWWQGEKFDRILLDAPCSATGVIRRHPDIKWLRKSSDIQELAKLQAAILDNCWQWLKPGGTMLYATCSIMPMENQEQITTFLKRTADAQLIPIAKASINEIGWQIIPGEQQMDGFYFALLRKNN